MDVCYNKLFKLLIDKGMKRTDLRKMTGISPNTLTKLSNNEFVSMEVLVKICRLLACDIGDIVEIAKSPENEMVSLVALGGEQV
jgi:putative transcriptional regulator